MLSENKKWCLFCSKEYDNIEDLLHHMEAAHDVPELRVLLSATVQKLKKEQCNYKLDGDAPEKAGFECPDCFELKNNVEELIAHMQTIHKRTINPQLMETIQMMAKAVAQDNEEAGLCTNCNTRYRGIIATKIKGKAEMLCVNCYQSFWGKPALERITMGTPPNVIEQMRIPVK